MADNRFSSQLGEVAHTSERPDQQGVGIQETMRQALPWRSRARNLAGQYSTAGAGVGIFALIAAGLAGYYFWQRRRDSSFGMDRSMDSIDRDQSYNRDQSYRRDQSYGRDRGFSENFS